jgi:hypothetical protein
MIGVRHVLEALAAYEDIQGEVMARFRAGGGLATRWQRRDRWAMADALSRTQDALENGAGGRWTFGRTALSTIRRQVEDELNDEERLVRGAA